MLPTAVSANENLFILPSPLAICAPGQLNVQIVNLSTSTANIDMAFYFAVPNGNLGETSAALVTNTVKR